MYSISVNIDNDNFGYLCLQQLHVVARGSDQRESLSSFGHCAH